MSNTEIDKEGYLTLRNMKEELSIFCESVFLTNGSIVILNSLRAREIQLDMKDIRVSFVDHNKEIIPNKIVPVFDARHIFE